MPTTSPLLHFWQDYLTAIMVGRRDPELLEFWITACLALAENPCRTPLLWSNKVGRLAPRPLPAHLANAAML
jgi:hypothetical protein